MATADLHKLATRFRYLWGPFGTLHAGKSGRWFKQPGMLKVLGHASSHQLNRSKSPRARVRRQESTVLARVVSFISRGNSVALSVILQ